MCHLNPDAPIFRSTPIRAFCIGLNCIPYALAILGLLALCNRHHVFSFSPLNSFGDQKALAFLKIGGCLIVAQLLSCCIWKRKPGKTLWPVSESTEVARGALFLGLKTQAMYREFVKGKWRSMPISSESTARYLKHLVKTTPTYSSILQKEASFPENSPFAKLPPEMIVEICSRLDEKNLKKLSWTCNRFNQIIHTYPALMTTLAVQLDAELCVKAHLVLGMSWLAFGGTIVPAGWNHPAELWIKADGSLYAMTGISQPLVFFNENDEKTWGPFYKGGCVQEKIANCYCFTLIFKSDDTEDEFDPTNSFTIKPRAFFNQPAQSFDSHPLAVKNTVLEIADILPKLVEKKLREVPTAKPVNLSRRNYPWLLFFPRNNSFLS